MTYRSHIITFTLQINFMLVHRNSTIFIYLFIFHLPKYVSFDVYVFFCDFLSIRFDDPFNIYIYIYIYIYHIHGFDELFYLIPNIYGTETIYIYTHQLYIYISIIYIYISIDDPWTMELIRTGTRKPVIRSR